MCEEPVAGAWEAGVQYLLCGVCYCNFIVIYLFIDCYCYYIIVFLVRWFLVLGSVGSMVG